MQLLLLNGREKVLKAFESGIFSNGKQRKRFTSILNCIANVSDRKVFNHKQLRILTAKQILQRSTIALAQVKADNKSENSLNEIRQVQKKLIKKYMTI